MTKISDHLITADARIVLIVIFKWVMEAVLFFNELDSLNLLLDLRLNLLGAAQ